MRFLLALGRTLVLIRHFLILLVSFITHALFWYLTMIIQSKYHFQKDCVALSFLQSINKYFRSKHLFRFPASGGEFQPSSPTTSRLDTCAFSPDRKVASDPTRAGSF